MAWDALQGRFQKQRTEEDKGLAQEARSVGGSGGSSGYAPQANPTGGFGGNAGSTTSGGPVSAGFVNYADLYSANEGKAKQMAADVYKGAESKAQGAKDSLQAARNQFAGKAQAGAGSYAPIGGAHGTRIENKTTAPAADVPQPDVVTPSKPKWRKTYRGGFTPGEGAYDETIKTADMGGAQAPITLGGSLSDAVAAGEAAAEARKQPGMTNAGASRYGELFGPTTGVLRAPDASGRADYHHSVSELEAKSGAGQDYTGPDSLKDSLGDAGYAALIKQYADAQNAIGGLQSSGGIAEALGYAGDQTGNAALDAGLTQTAGQSNFKRLADRYSGLGKEVAAAQDDSIRAASGARAQSDAAAGAWEQMLKDYEAQANVDPNAPIIIGAAQSEGETGANIGIRADSQGSGTMSDQFGSIFGTLDEDKGVSQVMSSGYSQQEVMDIWDSLSADEKKALTTKSTDIQSGAEGMFGQETWTGLLESIKAKLAAARAKKQGGA